MILYNILSTSSVEQQVLSKLSLENETFLFQMPRMKKCWEGLELPSDWGNLRISVNIYQQKLQILITTDFNTWMRIYGPVEPLSNRKMTFRVLIKPHTTRDVTVQGETRPGLRKKTDLKYFYRQVVISVPSSLSSIFEWNLSWTW